jgi:Xaa-Pro dipeptidase
LDACINSDTRFVQPNTDRLGLRADAAKRAASALRETHEGRALLLTTPSSVNWRTGGLSNPIDITAASDPVWVLDSDHGGALITSDIEAPRLERDYRVSDLGWDVVSAPWYDDDARLSLACDYAGVSALELLSDTVGVGKNVRNSVIAARLTLSAPEQEELRELGSLVGRVLGAGLDAWIPGVTTDFDTASAISAALEAEGATAVCLIVGGDDRMRALRHPLSVGAVVHDAMMAVVVAKRAGLHIAATRIALRNADDDIATLMKSVASVHDTVVEASLPGGTWGESVEALAAGYEEIGQPDAWREHYQGGPIGFEQREFELAPGHTDSPFWHLERRAPYAVAWNPSLRGGAKLEETYLIGDSVELLTRTPGWPLDDGPLGAPRSSIKVL